MSCPKHFACRLPMLLEQCWREFFTRARTCWTTERTMFAITNLKLDRINVVQSAWRSITSTAAMTNGSVRRAILTTSIADTLLASLPSPIASYYSISNKMNLYYVDLYYSLLFIHLMAFTCRHKHRPFSHTSLDNILVLLPLKLDFVVKRVSQVDT